MRKDLEDAHLQLVQSEKLHLWAEWRRGSPTKSTTPWPES